MRDRLRQGERIMRRLTFPTVVLAACLASSIALAASDQKRATFESLAASGVTGEARLNPMVQGGTQIHESLRGLLPNTEYVSVIYQNGTCTTGGTTFEIAHFTANPAGNAQLNKLVSQDI